ncbi:MAG: ATPase, T2SS/T4P/T4SS family, partial [Planctomycetota bacterium]|nr:ATPase, T2SS/T4P/T4SS family [Planctomycetota bacterium]
PESVRSEIELQLRTPKGVILLTGPAGSGKTTTIYAALQYILETSGGAKNIVTVEDPVERLLSGVTQTQVHPATGLTFARCLRSLMRQDPVPDGRSRSRLCR